MDYFMDFFRFTIPNGFTHGYFAEGKSVADPIVHVLYMHYRSLYDILFGLSGSQNERLKRSNYYK